MVELWVWQKAGSCDGEPARAQLAARFKFECFWIHITQNILVASDFFGKSFRVRNNRRHPYRDFCKILPEID